MTTELAITLDDDQKERLYALAEARHETVANMVAEAVSQYLDYDEWFLAEVEKGREDVRAGRLHDADEVIGRLRRKAAERIESSKP